MDGKRSAETNPPDLPLAKALLQLIAAARDESARRQHEYVGTEHLVLALSRQAGDAAPLLALAVEPQRVYAVTSEIVQRGVAPKSNATGITVHENEHSRIERPFTSRTKRAFALAAETAQQLGHTHIDVPHLLVGLLREQLNLGAQVLAGEGLTIERAYEFARHSGAHGPPG